MIRVTRAFGDRNRGRKYEGWRDCHQTVSRIGPCSEGKDEAWIALGLKLLGEGSSFWVDCGLVRDDQGIIREEIRWVEFLGCGNGKGSLSLIKYKSKSKSKSKS